MVSICQSYHNNLVAYFFGPLYRLYYGRSLRPSVHLSVSNVDCVKTIENIVKLFNALTTTTCLYLCECLQGGVGLAVKHACSHSVQPTHKLSLKVHLKATFVRYARAKLVHNSMFISQPPIGLSPLDSIGGLLSLRSPGFGPS